VGTISSAPSARQTAKELLEPARRLREGIPEVIGGYASMQQAVMVEGALSVKVKELIGVVVMMNGGPGTVWGPRAAAAHREFSPPASRT
jgi:hypothetical protein